MKKLLTLLVLAICFNTNAQCSFTLTATASSSAICDDGVSTCTLTASGAITYTWAPAATLSSVTGATVVANPTSTMVYSVTGSDGSCTETVTVSVNVNPLPTIIVSDATICLWQETATLTATGAMTYSWNTGTTMNPIYVNPNSTTIYTVGGTDMNGCINYTTTTVNVNPLPIITASANIVCINTPCTIIASGATLYEFHFRNIVPPYNNIDIYSTTSSSYSYTPLSAFSYTIGGTDSNGCMNDISGTINANPLPTVTITPYPSLTVCGGDSIDLIASGAVTYNWHTNNSSLTSVTPYMPDWPTQTTTYYLTGTDANGCIGTDSTTVMINSTPAISFSIIPDVTPHVWDIIPNISGSTSSYIYEWSWGDGDTTGGYTPYTNHTYTAAANYNVCLLVADTNSGCISSYCENDSLYRTNANNTVVQINVVNGTSGISQISNQNSQIKIYPNPVNSILQVSVSNETLGQIKIVDVLGNEILQTQQKQIDVSNFQNGVYFIRVGASTQKFIVQH